MEENQIIRRLGPHIKLFKRHVSEWNDLLAYQREVRHSVQEEISQIVNSLDRMAMLERVIEKRIRLKRLVTRQAEERQEMRARHQQEEIDLEEILTKQDSCL